MIFISTGYRVGKVEDEVGIGDEVLSKCGGAGQGRINLTRLGIHPDQAAARGSGNNR